MLAELEQKKMARKLYEPKLKEEDKNTIKRNEA